MSPKVTDPATRAKVRAILAQHDRNAADPYDPTPSRLAQGLPPTIEDPAAIARVAVIVRRKPV